MISEPPIKYIDIRHADKTEHISLDLTRHLPRRLVIGPAVVVTERPDLLLPVIRKRWMKVIREVERQYSSTLDRQKKYELLREIERMHSFTFTSDASATHADVLLIRPSQTVCTLPRYSTLYILAPLTHQQFLATLEHAQQPSLLTVYGEHHLYEKALRCLTEEQVTQYGDGTYPVQPHLTNTIKETRVL